MSARRHAPVWMLGLVVLLAPAPAQAAKLSQAERKAVTLTSFEVTRAGGDLIVKVSTAGDFDARAGKGALRSVLLGILLRAGTTRVGAVATSGRSRKPVTRFTPALGPKPIIARLGRVTWFVIHATTLGGATSVRADAMRIVRRRSRATPADYETGLGLGKRDSLATLSGLAYKDLPPGTDCSSLRAELAALDRLAVDIDGRISRVGLHIDDLTEQLGTLEDQARQLNDKIVDANRRGQTGKADDLRAQRSDVWRKQAKVEAEKTELSKHLGDLKGNVRPDVLGRAVEVRLRLNECNAANEQGNGGQNPGGNNTGNTNTGNTGGNSDPSGTLKDIATKRAGNVTAIARGATGKMIFAQEGTPDAVGSLDIGSGVVTDVSIDDLTFGPSDVDWGPDSMIWFASSQRVGRADPGAGTFVSWPESNSPVGGTFANGVYWYGAQSGNSVQEVPLTATANANETPHATGASTGPTDVELVDSQVCWSQNGNASVGCSVFSPFTPMPTSLSGTGCTFPRDMDADGSAVFYVGCAGSGGATGSRIVQVTRGMGVTDSWIPSAPGSVSRVAVGGGKIFFLLNGFSGFAVLDPATDTQTPVSLSCVPLALVFGGDGLLYLGCSGGKIVTYKP